MQIGGALASLEEHIALATAHPLLGAGIDYKLAPSQGPTTPQAAQESGFNALSVTLCKVRACLYHMLPDCALQFLTYMLQVACLSIRTVTALVLACLLVGHTCIAASRGFAYCGEPV